MTNNLTDFRDFVVAKAAYRRDYDTTLPALIAGMINPTRVQTEEGELVLTDNGFKQLVHDRLKLPPSIFERRDLTNDLKLEILRQASAGVSDRQIKVRVNGNQIDSLLSEEYAFFDNAMLATTLWQLSDSGVMPNAEIMNYHLSPNGRDMQVRLRFPEWDMVMPERDNRKTNYLTNLVIKNNEVAMGAFSANVAITRGPCLNTTVGQSVWRVEHRLSSYSDFLSVLTNAIGYLRAYAEEMFDQLRSMQSISVESPVLVFERIGEELGVPKYAMRAARDYYDSEGGGNTMYDIVQSVSAGLRDMSDKDGRRQPNWTNRLLIENKLWDTAVALQNLHAAGESIDDWSLHGVEGVKELCARYILNWKGQIEEAEMLADGIRDLEIHI